MQDPFSDYFRLDDHPLRSHPTHWPLSNRPLSNVLEEQAQGAEKLTLPGRYEASNGPSLGEADVSEKSEKRRSCGLASIRAWSWKKTAFWSILLIVFLLVIAIVVVHMEYAKSDNHSNESQVSQEYPTITVHDNSQSSHAVNSTSQLLPMLSTETIISTFIPTSDGIKRVSFETKTTLETVITTRISKSTGIVTSVETSQIALTSTDVTSSVQTTDTTLFETSRIVTTSTSIQPTSITLTQTSLVQTTSTMVTSPSPNSPPPSPPPPSSAPPSSPSPSPSPSKSPPPSPPPTPSPSLSSSPSPSPSPTSAPTSTTTATGVSEHKSEDVQMSPLLAPGAGAADSILTAVLHSLTAGDAGTTGIVPADNTGAPSRTTKTAAKTSTIETNGQEVLTSKTADTTKTSTNSEPATHTSSALGANQTSTETQGNSTPIETKANQARRGTTIPS